MSIKTFYISKNIPITSRQLELEEEIKARINLRLKKGVYKLTTKESNKIDIWRRFATITKGNGTSLNGYVCCTNCSKILRNRRNNLNHLEKHVCFSQELSSEISAATQDSHYMEDEISEDSLEGEIENITIIDPIWESFDIALVDNGTDTYGLISCRQCQRELKYDNTIRTKAERQSHICLGSSFGQRECFIKLMPTQDEIEEKIRATITENLKADIFKLKFMPNRKGSIWKVFGVITKADDSVVSGWIQCSKCAKLFKYLFGKYSTSLYKHECLAKINTAELEKSRESVEKNIALERKMENKLITIWDTFDLTLVDDGDSVDGLISCRQCNVVLKSDYSSITTRLQQTHTCLAASEGGCRLKIMPIQHEVTEKIELEISRKIKAGLFKITANGNSKSHFWNVFALIAKCDGSVINGYIGCKSCAKVFRISRCKMYNHSCLNELYTNGVADDPEDYLSRAVKRTITERQTENIITSVWETFDLTLVDAGNTTDGLIYCRQCNMKMEYNNVTASTELLQTHKCAAGIEGECRPKMMPSRAEVAEKINMEISNKIKSGLFKVTKQRTNRRSNLWQVFAMITKADDSIVKGYIYCTKCTEIHKYLNASEKVRSTIYKHRCLRKLSTGEVEEPAEVYSEPVNETVDMSDVASPSLGYGMENNIISIWETFDLTMRIEGNIVDELITCRQCNMVLKYNYTIMQQQTHNCLGKSLKVLPHQDEVEEKIKLEISKKINVGDFKLTMNQIDKALVWKVMALITHNTDGTTISGYVCCTKCNTVLKVQGFEIKTLQSHACYLRDFGGEDASGTACSLLLDVETDSSCSKTSTVPDYHEWQSKMEADIHTKISSGEYKMRKSQNSKSLKSNILAKITKKDGSILKGYIYCTKCKSLLKNNDRIRTEHKCLWDSDITLSNNSENSFQEDETSETSVKRFRIENIEEDGATTDNSEQSVKKRKANDKENDSNKKETGNIQNNIEQLLSNENDPLWLRFELISATDGSTLLSCRKCRMVLQYDGSTKLHLKDHKCFSFAPLPSTICKGNDFEFIDEPINIETPANKVKTEDEMDDDFAEICVKEEFIYVDYLTANNSAHSSSIVQPLAITVNEDAYQKRLEAVNWALCKDNIKIKEEFDASIIYANKQINNSNSLNNTEDLEKSNSTAKQNRSNDFTEDKGEANNTDKPKTNGNFTEDKGETSNGDKQKSNTSSIAVPKLEQSGVLLKLLSSWKQCGMKYFDTLNIQDSQTDSTKLLQHIHQIAEGKRLEIKSKIKEISNSQTISISTDFWRDTLLEKDFFKATLHYNTNYELGNIILGVQHMDFPPQNSAQTLQNKLENLLKDLGIEKIENIIFITDIDQHLAKNLDNSFIHMKCSRHLFEKVLETAIENTTELKETIKNCKIILQHLPTTYGGNLLQIKTETVSKSSYCLFKSITNNWLKVKDMLTVRKESLISPEVTITRLQNLIELCQRFELIFKRLEDNQTPSLCFVILSIERLKAISETITNDTAEMKSLKTNLLKNIQEIWLTNISIWHKAACFLYPPAKLQQENDLYEIKQFCIKQMRQFIPTSGTEDMDSFGEETDDISFFFPDLIESKNNRTKKNVEEEEIHRYSQQRITIDKHFNVLQWWQNNSTKYPHLSRLALQILSIPASIKRLQLIFPQCENVIKENVSSLLSLKDMENILFLNSCS